MRFAFVAVLAAAAVTAGAAAPTADAHRSGCHRWHSCPSDHATYRWGPKKLLCVAPYSDKRTSAHTIRVVYEGRAYLCRR